MVDGVYLSEYQSIKITLEFITVSTQKQYIDITNKKCSNCELSKSKVRSSKPEVISLF